MTRNENDLPPVTFDTPDLNVSNIVAAAGQSTLEIPTPTTIAAVVEVPPMSDDAWKAKIEAEKAQVPPTVSIGVSSVISESLISAPPIDIIAKPPVDPLAALNLEPSAPTLTLEEEKKAALADLKKEHLARIHLGDDNELRALAAAYEVESGKSLQRAINDGTVDTWLYDLLMTDRQGIDSDQVGVVLQALEKLKAKGQTLTQSSGVFTDNFSNGKIYPPVNGQPPVLRGKDARVAVIARLRGVRRALLMNSGFYVVVRPLTLIELNEFISSVKDEAKEFGRTLGGHFYLFADVFCKAKFMELFVSCVEDSNLIDYDREGVLMENISLHDFDTCVWALTSLMYRDGCPVDIYCTDPKCKHVDTDQLIDLNKVRYNNFNIMTKDAIAYMGKMMTDNSKVTVDQVKKYRNDYLKFDKIVTSNNVRYELQVPMMGKFLDIGSTLVSKMLASIQGSDYSIHNDEVSSALALSIYRMYTPWIKQANYLNPDGTIQFVTDDLEAIMDMTEADHIEHNEFDINVSIEDYIAETKISYLCTTTLECPTCHKKPTGAIDDFLPLDMLRYFFFLACQQLMSTGLR